jgi:hypothetical protein
MGSFMVEYSFQSLKESLMYDQDTLMKIHTWRQKAMKNELTQEETRDIINHLRQGRAQAVTAQKASRAKSAPITEQDVDAMFDELPGGSK